MCFFPQAQHPLCHSTIIVSSPPQLRSDMVGETISLSRSGRAHQRALQVRNAPKAESDAMNRGIIITTAIVQFIFLTCLSNIRYGFIHSVSRACLLQLLAAKPKVPIFNQLCNLLPQLEYVAENTHQNLSRSNGLELVFCNS